MPTKSSSPPDPSSGAEVVEVVGGPRYQPGAVLFELHLGPHSSEVEELLRVDLGELLRRQIGDQVPEGARGGLRGIRPPGEGNNHRRELGCGLLVNDQTVHNCALHLLPRVLSPGIAVRQPERE